MKSSSRLSRLKMSNRIPFISSKKRPGEQGDINDVKCNYNMYTVTSHVGWSSLPLERLRLGEHAAEADNSNGARADDTGTDSSVDSICIDVETEEGSIPVNGDDQALLIEERILASRTLMASPSLPPPSPSPPSRPSSPQLATADKAVQSSVQTADIPVRRAEFARTVHTFFNEHQSHTDNAATRETIIDEAVQTAALVHMEDPEVIVRSLAVPLALAAPCRSKPPRCSPSSSFDGREIGPANGQIGRGDANSCAASGGIHAGGDASTVATAISSTGSSSPCFGLEDFTGGMKRSSSRIDDRCPEDSCMESCVYYSVRCCECIVL